MAENIKVLASERDVKGSSASRRLRRSGSIPAIMYGNNIEPQMVITSAHALTQLLRHHNSESMLVDLEIEGKPSQKVLMENIQYHPVKGNVLHVDFRAVSMTEKLQVSVPVELS